MTDKSETTATESTVVKTYIPAYQKEIWKEDAEELDMSQSEFVRTMVQAGRDTLGITEEQSDSERGEPLAAYIRSVLDEAGPVAQRELEILLNEDIEEVLEELMQAGEVTRDDRDRFALRDR